jgi:ubiquinone biosynthesis protein COQ9
MDSMTDLGLPREQLSPIGATDTPANGPHGDADSAANSLDALRQRLVLAALDHVPFDGWSDRALSHAAADLGLDAAAPARLFPHGVSSAVECFTALADGMMVRDIAAQNLSDLGVRERIISGIRLRLERWGPHKESVRRALAVYALPQNMPSAAHATWTTVDMLWKAIGDRSADFSWYSKRASLAAIYSATLLYWLDDQSEDHAETWSFLSRRVDDVVKTIQFRQKAGKAISSTLERLPNPLNLLPRRRTIRR